LDANPSPELLAQAQTQVLPEPPPSRLRRAWRRLDRVFVLTVLVPTLLAGLYYGAVASDVFISESRFVVRSPQRPAQGGLGALLQGTVFSRSQDDTYSVHDYIRSRDALQELDSKLAFRKALSDPAIDRLSRFPALDFDASFEGFYKHYQKHVAIEYDSVSSISVLRVRAFTAEDAKKVNELLLEMSERLVNNLNIRSREDLIRVAQVEVRNAEERAKTAAEAVSGFRSDRGVFDPDRQSALQLQAVGRQREELLAAETQLAQLRQAPGYERVVLEKTFAERQLASALTALDSARNEAQRKQLYLERLVQPNRPDNALEPRRVRSILTVLVAGLLLWGVVSLVLASVREHTE
jgi:capsular polysaccharide transport system permease protein